MAKSKKNGGGKVNLGAGAVGPRKGEPVIDESNWRDHVAPVVDGQIKAHGLVPRDYASYPREMFAPPSQLQIIPQSEWRDRLKEKVARKAELSDIRGDVPSLDQNGQGYCWVYSVGATIMIRRLASGQKYVRPSPHAVACKIKGFRDEGGWCGLGAKFGRDVGFPDESVWPQKSMDRSLDNPETWKNAAKYKITDDWVDLAAAVYDQNLSFAMIATCLLLNNPCAVDFNWWGHSVCALDLVEVEANSWGIRILNSWTDGWGQRGMGVLRGRQAIPNGAVCTRGVIAS